LLRGAVIQDIVRHGKDFALIAEDGRTLGVHLGMSGWLHWAALTASDDATKRLDHVHCQWQFEGPGETGMLLFRDPRRFGGLWVYPSVDAWRTEKLAGRGPDALDITSRALIAAIEDSQRPIKAALLDQAVLAGVGNIYADEALFAACIHPATKAKRLGQHRATITELARCIRMIMRKAIRSGGSTIRTYRGVNGEVGSFVRWHRVYGRAGLPCVRCGHTLRSMHLAQRTTVYCPHCQARGHLDQT